jgi:hypothetical protein
MPNGLNDRRGFLRRPFKTEVTIESGGLLIRSDSEVNVSMSGLSMPFAGGAAPEHGAPCSASITLKAFENRILIEAKGKIIRSDRRNLAVEFTELDVDSYNHLRQLILNNSEDPERAEAEFSAHWGIRPRP